MKERIGEWMIVEGALNYLGVRQILEFQKHGDKRKFGNIGVSRHLISGKALRKWEQTH